MTMTRLFPFLVAVLDVGAGVVYCYNHQWRLGLVWVLYGVAAGLLGSAK